MTNIKLKTKRVYPDRTKFRESREIQWESVWHDCEILWEAFKFSTDWCRNGNQEKHCATNKQVIEAIQALWVRLRTF